MSETAHCSGVLTRTRQAKAVIYVQSPYHARYGCGLLVVETDEVHFRTHGREI